MKTEKKNLSRLLSDAMEDSAFYQTRLMHIENAETSHLELLRAIQDSSYQKEKIQLDELFMFYTYQSKLVSNNVNAFDMTSNREISDILRECFSLYEYDVLSIQMHNRLVENHGLPWSINDYDLLQKLNSSGDIHTVNGNLKLKAILYTIRIALNTSNRCVVALNQINLDLIIAIRKPKIQKS